MCDEPTSTKADALARTRGLVDRHGWAIEYVLGDEVYPPWAYTVGLVRHGLPELVVSGLSEETTHDLLNDTAHGLASHGRRCEPGRRLTLADGREAEVVELPHPDVHLLTVTSLFPDHPLRALQLVWCDDHERWPWDAGFRGGRGGQPVLGPRRTER